MNRGKSESFIPDARNMLGDLTSVLKCSAAGCGAAQARAFTFDSLSRLVSAFNLESGTVSYSFGTANTLRSRTDALGHATSYS